MVVDAPSHVTAKALRIRGPCGHASEVLGTIGPRDAAILSSILPRAWILPELGRRKSAYNPQNNKRLLRHHYMLDASSHTCFVLLFDNRPSTNYTPSDNGCRRFLAAPQSTF
jgi:hypothetical protein